MNLRYRLILIAAVIAFGTLFFSTAHAQSYGSYSYRKRIILNSKKYVSGSADLNNFTVLLAITDPDLIRTGTTADKLRSPSADDIAFTDAAIDQSSATEYNYQVESYNATTGELKVWVKIPSLKHDSDNEIYFYFGSPNPGAHPSAADTWKASYKAIFHFNEPAYSTATNAVKEGKGIYNATISSGATLVEGKIGKAYSFGGAQNIVTSNDLTFDKDSAFTISAWIKPASVSANQRIVSNMTGDDNRGFSLSLGGSKLEGEINGGSNSTTSGASGGEPIVAGEWQFVQLIFSPWDIITYRNGVLDRMGWSAGSHLGGKVYIGSSHPDKNGIKDYFHGVIDEVRISKGALSPDWIKTEYRNQQYPGNTGSGTGLDGGAPFILAYGSLETVNMPPSAPSDIDDAANIIAENAANGTPVGITASASDPDGATVTYSLSDDAGGRFTIDPATGVVTVANGLLLDFELATSHTITIDVSDGAFSTSASFTIAVSNIVESLSSIVDINTAENSIPENIGTGAIVSITAFAAHETGSVISYALSDNAGGRFTIDPVSGVVKVAVANFDYETNVSHSITVSATDGSTTIHQSFTIAITDVFDSFSSSYVLQKKITLNNNLLGISADLVNYPVLLKVQDTNLIPGQGCAGVILSDSHPDVAFVDPENPSRELNYEIESFDPKTGTLLVWVKVPLVKASSANTLYMYFGIGTPSPAHTPAFFKATWSDVTGGAKSFKGVWHFNEDPAVAAVADATASGNNLDQSSGVSQDKSSLIGKGVTLENGAIFKTGVIGLPATNVSQTISLWAYYPRVPISTGNMVSVQNAGSSAIQMGPRNDDIWVWKWAYDYPLVTKNPKPAAGAWHHYVFTYDSSTNISSLYIDGVLGNSNNSETPQNNTPNAISFGAYLNTSNGVGGEFFNGSIDEAQIIDAVLSADWIKASYIIQSDPAAYTGNGSVEVNRTNAESLKGALVYAWTGSLSTDSSDPRNWINLNTGSTNDMPSISGSASIIVPSGLSRYPVLSADLSAYGLVLASGASISLNGQTLNVKCNFHNSGSLLYNGNSNSTLAFNGSAVLQEYYGTSVNAEVGKLSIANAGGNVSLAGGQIDVYNLLTVSSNILYPNGLLNLKASETKTAAVAPIPNGALVNGDVNVEVYFSGGTSALRGTRSITSPVDESKSALSTYQQLKRHVIITGPGGGAKGFDPGGPINPNAASLTRYNEAAKNSESQYTNVASITEPLPPGYGVFLYYRGNRDGYSPEAAGSSNKLVAPFAIPESTVVKYTGTINQGQIRVPLSFTNHAGESNRNGFNLIGNPYPAIIDWHAVDKAGLGETLIVAKPAGGFATYNSLTEATVNAPGDLRYIQPGLAFYVVASGPGAAVTFNENNKVQPTATPSKLLRAPSPDRVFAFSNEVVQVPKITSSKLKVLRFNLEDDVSTEEAVTVFGPSFSSSASREDAVFFGGSTVSLSTISVDNVKLVINGLPLVTSTTVIPLSVNSLISGAVKLSFTDLSGLENSKLYLVDKYLNKTLEINQGNSSYAFSINKSVAASFGDNRFEMVVSPPTVLPVGLAYFTARKESEKVGLNWATLSEKASKEFIIERSTDGKSFSLMGKIRAAGNSNSRLLYGFKDTEPVKGLNYYRLTLVNEDDTEDYSSIASVNYSLQNDPELGVYPNPVSDVLNIFYQRNYKTLQVEVISEEGKIVKKKAFTSSELLQLSISDLSAGSYILRLKDEAAVMTRSVQFIKY